MSRIKISGRSVRDPELQNIPLRSDLGAKLRAALRDQQPERGRVLASIDYSGLELKIHAQYVDSLKKDDGRG